MTHSSSPKPLRAGFRPAVSGYVLATAVAALVFGAGVALTNADAVVSHGFAAALSGGAGPAGVRDNPSAPLVAGSEDYWLMRARKGHDAGARMEPVAWSALPAPFAVSVGDRITITSDGKERVLEVVAVEDVTDQVTRIDPAAPAQAHRIVTCRDASSDHGTLVQFVTGAPEKAPVQTSSAKPVRTL